MSIHTPTPHSPAAAAYERLRQAGSTAYGASLDLQMAQETLTNVLHDLQSLADQRTARLQADRLRSSYQAADRAARMLSQAYDEMTAAAGELQTQEVAETLCD